MPVTETNPLAGLPYADRINAVTVADVIEWLSMGYDDLRSAGRVSVAYGLIFVVAGLFILVGLTAAGMPYLITPMIGGFLLVGPLLAMGFYRISVRLERGQSPGFLDALGAWRGNSFHILTAGLVLMLYLMIWARLSVLIFVLFFPYQALTLTSFAHQIASWQGVMFLAFGTAVGGVIAIFAFLCTVVALPHMMQNRTDIFSAAVLSLMCVLRNPGPMAVWAGLIALLVGGSALLGMVGLAVTLPVVGHASWHAYRALVRETGS